MKCTYCYGAIGLAVIEAGCCPVCLNVGWDDDDEEEDEEDEEEDEDEDV